MIRVALRMLRQHPASAIATFLALGLAAAIVTISGVLFESGLRFHGSADRYAGTPVLVASTAIQVGTGDGDTSQPLTERGRIDPALLSQIARLPGVRAAIGDVAITAQLDTAGGPTAVELHPSSAAELTPFELRSGAWPATTDQVALDARLAASLAAGQSQSALLGRPLRLGLAGGEKVFTVAGIAEASVPTAMPTVFVADAEASALAGNTVQPIGVLPQDGVRTSVLAKAVRAELPKRPAGADGAFPHVYTGPNRGSVPSPSVDNAREFIIVISCVFGGCTLLIAILVIAETIGLSVRQRHRDFALLRAVAATPRQVRRLVVRETFCLGLVAAGIGVWPGLAAASWVGGQFVSRGMAPAEFHTRLSWLPPLVAGVAVLLIAVCSAWFASLRASRIRPTEALAEASVERPRIGVTRALLGLVALAGGITVMMVASSATADNAVSISVGTVFTLVTAAGLLGPVFIRLVARVAGIALRAFGITGRLAAANMDTSARRLSSVVTTGVLAVGLAGSLWFLQTSQEHVAGREVRQGLVANYVVAPGGGLLQPNVAASLREVDGVVAATGVVQSTMLTAAGGGTSYSAQGLDPAGVAATIDLGVTAGDLSQLRGDTIAVDSRAAKTMGLRVGDSFVGWFGDGAPATLKVVALYARGLGFAQLTVPHDLLAEHTSAGVDSAVFVATRDSLTVDALRARLAELAPGTVVSTGAGFQAKLSADMVENAWTTQVITAVLLVYVVIAAANTLITYALGRRREFAILRLAGTTRRQVIRMARQEQALLLGLVLVLGSVIAAATLIPMVRGATGSALPYIPLTGWVAVIAGTLAVGGLASALPVRRALRMRPVEAIGIKE
ncbi:MAG: FtsX-like permease family protein [Actinomycetia bacterium]|nr:FtsX-like permease family protein [Actinomycetes bacterium]